MEINEEFIKDFLIRYSKTGKPGICKIYGELYWENDEASQFLYYHIKYMVDNKLLEGDTINFWNITPRGRNVVGNATVATSKKSFVEKFKGMCTPIANTTTFLNNVFSLANAVLGISSK